MSPISTAYPARCRRVDGHPGYEFRDFPATGQGDDIVSEPQQRHRHLPGHHITTRGAGHGAAAGPGGIDEEDLDSVRRAGYATEDYERWQFGQCATYARALMQMKPGLKFGVMGVGSGEHKYPTHFFAHDNRYAYDSAGRHPLPYRGITHHADYCDLDQDPQGPTVPPDASGQGIAAAQDHARRNGILEGRHQNQAIPVNPCQAADVKAAVARPPAQPGTRRPASPAGPTAVSTTSPAKLAPRRGPR